MTSDDYLNRLRIPRLIATIRELDVVALTVALGSAIPAVLNAITSFRNRKLLKKHDTEQRQRDHAAKFSRQRLSKDICDVKHQLEDRDT